MGGAKNQVFENKEVMLMKAGNGALTQKDVENEGRSGWSIENKGAEKVLLRVCSK